MIDATDLKIIENIKAGDVAAYALLIDKYKNMVFTLAYNIIQNREDAEELSQDVFVKAFRSLSSFRNESSFSTWLYRIVINTSLNKKKLHRLKIELISDDMESFHSVFVDINSLQEHQTNDIKKNIQEAIRLLKLDERLCITLFYINELTIAEINELTEINISNIKVLLHRGRKSLYHHLKLLLKTEIDDLI